MTKRTLIVMAAVGLCAVMAQAGVRADLSGDRVVGFDTTMDMPFVAVGNADNVPDTEVMTLGGTTGYGSVGYGYWIGKFEVTTGQYTEFLNAVAATDTYGLYNTSMWTAIEANKISRSGESGAY